MATRCVHINEEARTHQCRWSHATVSMCEKLRALGAQQTGALPRGGRPSVSHPDRVRAELQYAPRLHRGFQGVRSSALTGWRGDGPASAPTTAGRADLLESGRIRGYMGGAFAQMGLVTAR